MTDPRETLARIRAQADAATEGPLEHEPPPGPGEDPMRPICVYPKEDGGTLAYVQPLEADAEFIAAARTTVPALLDLADAVLKRHAPMPIYVLAEDCEAPDDHQHGSTPDGGDDLCWDEPTGEVLCCECRDEWGERVEHPCPDYTAITTALEGLHDA